ncbi:YiiX/YebB-like N1pC/P60 family cysteine hydrolase [Lentisphaera marina]|uniref:YiiX/YebB-like N1pC/P60 family cysteine hydrolase n=1 Tax=Lentisphaera marina TaxID=1111041 RepID=UPI002366BC2F|nr:YiiX/YebB-like N1pC/P60 family cysteine hydrolase [Lentisphaera marina]MDD7984915.1 YiiX/YebB-like N1pC/P60 family cysteine hydrolase [Lentisphaera marina]
MLKNLFVTFVLSLLLGSCTNTTESYIDESLQEVGVRRDLSPQAIQTLNLKDKFLDERIKTEESILDASIHYFSRLHEWSLSYRQHILTLAKEVEKTQGPLKGELILKLVQANNNFVQLRYALYSLLKSNRNYYDRTFNHWSDQHYYKGLCLNLAVAVTLYDNMALSMELLEKHERVKSLFLEGSVDYQIPAEYNREVVKSFYSGRRRRIIRKKMDLFAQTFTDLNVAKGDDYLQYLAVLISQSPSALKIQEESTIGDFSTSISERVTYRASSLFDSHEKVLFKVSEAFGNGMGVFQSRMGLLHDNKEVLKEVASTLQPLDILLEKTPFRLTDKFIPGHFGHVALYLGTEKELKALGLWGDDLIRPYQQEIREGKVVLEALREGVVLNTVDHFMNVDDFAIVRKSQMTLKSQKKYMHNAFRQLGKEYDFSFDVETLNKIVCSELVYQVFTDESWQTAEALGRATISPDAIIEKIKNSNSYELVLFYHQGEKVLPEQQTKLALNLLSEDE